MESHGSAAIEQAQKLCGGRETVDGAVDIVVTRDVIDRKRGELAEEERKAVLMNAWRLQLQMPMLEADDIAKERDVRCG